ncbi:MAG: hypothetical protein KAS78_00150, partial [Candidatus Pacebacteria bacterium]|nr:hypothetical protein [Candidatus Paceibacterota bacterium]
QRFILDIVLSWTEKEKIKNSEIIKIAAKKLLEPSFGGTSSPAWNKITMHSGALNPSDFLGKIRGDTIGLLIELYYKTEDINEKISILNILDEVSRFPMQMYEENFEKMVYRDADRVVKFYSSIIFDNNKIIAPIAIAQEVEKQLIWFSKNQENQNDNITAFLAKLRKDKFYGLFRLFIGDILDRLNDTEDWQSLEKKRNKEIQKKLRSINSGNIGQWITDLNKIAEQKKYVEDWKFSNFNSFLQSLSGKKPELANLIITDAFKNKKPLAMFAYNFLFGFRKVNKINYWDKLAQKIIDKQDVDLIAGIFDTYGEAPINNIRTKDIDLLADIINKKEKFEFLRKEKFEKYEDFRLRHSIIRALLNVYYKDKIKIEKLMLKEMKANNKLQYIDIYLHQIDLYIYNKSEYKIIPDLSDKSIKYLCEVLVNIKSLDYHSQQLLVPIGQRDFKAMMNIFWRRMDLREKKG